MGQAPSNLVVRSALEPRQASTTDCNALRSTVRASCSSKYAPCLATATDDVAFNSCFCPTQTAYAWYSCESLNIGTCWNSATDGTDISSLYSQVCPNGVTVGVSTTTSSKSTSSVTPAPKSTTTTPPPSTTTTRTTTTPSPSPSTSSTTPTSTSTSAPPSSPPSSSSSTSSTSSSQTSSSSSSSSPNSSPVVILSTTPIPRVTPSSGSITTTSSTHSPIPPYPGSGSLLVGYCATPDYTLVDGGATVYYAPFVGCDGDKLDCCPFTAGTPLNTATITVPTTITQTAQIGATGPTDNAFPTAIDSAQSVMRHCADDYVSISGGCCPKGYLPWTAALGGQTPCFSTVPFAMTPPALDASIQTQGPKPTVAVINVIYAMQYPVADPGPSSLSTGTVAGISVGSVVAGLSLLGLGAAYFVRRRHKRQLEELRSSMGGTGGTGTLSPDSAAAPSRVTDMSENSPAAHRAQSWGSNSAFGPPMSTPPAQPGMYAAAAQPVPAGGYYMPQQNVQQPELHGQGTAGYGQYGPGQGGYAHGQGVAGYGPGQGGYVQGYGQPQAGYQQGNWQQDAGGGAYNPNQRTELSNAGMRHEMGAWQ